MAGMWAFVWSAFFVASIARAQSIDGVQSSFVADGCVARPDRKNCVNDAGCAWCALGQHGVPSCVEKAMVTILPSESVKCYTSAAQEDAEVVDAVILPHGATKLHSAGTCDATDPKACTAQPDCIWCNSKVSWIASDCFDKVGARFMATDLFQCGAESKPSTVPQPKTSQADAAKDYGRKHHPGSYPSPPPPPPPACDDITSKYACNERHSCNWCVLKFTGEGTCFTTTEAKYLPPFVFKCSKKHHTMQDNMSAALT